MKQPFRSSRLIYRGFEPARDEAYLYTLGQDAFAAANSDASLLCPRTKKKAEEKGKYFSERTMISVVICLPCTSSPAISEVDELDESAPRPSTMRKVENAIPVGMMYLSRQQPGQERHRNSSLGIEIQDIHQRKGYGREAIEWMVDWGFRFGGLHRISLDCFAWNEDARRLYESIGFAIEGRLRESFWFDGKWQDSLVLSVLEQEWMEKQA